MASTAGGGGRSTGFPADAEWSGEVPARSLGNSAARGDLTACGKCPQERTIHDREDYGVLCVACRYARAVRVIGGGV